MGRYHLVERLAVGGMAEVFLACERSGAHSLDRLVVIKRILPHLVEKHQFVEMFLREARIAARIGHPNVVEIYELGDSGGFPFIAMEYVAGSTLKQLVKAAQNSNRDLPFDVVLHLMVQACAGAHAAHELTDPQGRPYHLVHRDLTPHNLMVTDQAHIKLLDFGIAKSAMMDDSTRTGMLKGKISYMSPEQCRQEPLDRRSDIFALGIVAWELIAGRKPFAGRSELATMQAIVTGNLPHLREVRPDTPEPLAAAIHRALALHPDQRYATADEFRRELRQVSRICDLRLDEDEAAYIIGSLLGPAHERRRMQVDAALERTLVSLSSAGPELSEPRAPMSTFDTGSSAPTRTQAPGTDLATLSVSLFFVAMFGIAMTIGVGFALWNVLEDVEPPVTGEPVVLSLAPTLGDVMLTEHEPLRRYLQRTLRRPIRLAISEDYDDAVEGLKDGTVHFAMIPHGRAARALQQSEEPLSVIAVKVVDGSDGTDGYLVVPGTSHASSIADLKGSVICYSDPDSSTGYMLPRRYIRRQGLNPDTDFVAHFSGNHDQVLRDLLSGKCAVAGTYSGNYHTAGQRDIPIAQLRLLSVTGRTPHDAVVVGPGTDPALIEQVRDALLQLDPPTHVGSARIGQNERITGFTAPRDNFQVLDEFDMGRQEILANPGEILPLP